MKLLDRYVISLKAGNGGNGANTVVRFNKNNRILFTGGSGGSGGNVIVKFSHDKTMLEQFNEVLAAESGAHGSVKCKTGRNGKDLIIVLPYYTDIYNYEDNTLIFKFDINLMHNNFSIVLLKGEKGGKGSSYYGRKASDLERLGKITKVHRFALDTKLCADIILACTNFENIALYKKIFYALCNFNYQPIPYFCSKKNIFIGHMKSSHDIWKKYKIIFFPRFCESLHSKHLQESRVILYLNSTLDLTSDSLNSEKAFIQNKYILPIELFLREEKQQKLVINI